MKIDVLIFDTLTDLSLNIVGILYRAMENKKGIERAVINTLQLATRKNLIQMSSDVIINY
jgi:hypothetical protein